MASSPRADWEAAALKAKEEAERALPQRNQDERVRKPPERKRDDLRDREVDHV